MLINLNKYLFIPIMFIVTNIFSQIIPHTSFKLNCQDGSKMDALNIITDENQFENIRSNPLCSGIDFPDVDFENNFVIGYVGRGSGARYEIDTVSVVLKNSDYTVTISICKNGNYLILHYVYYWMIVPKLTEFVNVILKEEINHCNN